VLRAQVFDITRKVTYTNLSKWYAELQENRPSIPCIVVANKIDRKALGEYSPPAQV
jgi:GTPase SAR1 family protein